MVSAAEAPAAPCVHLQQHIYADFKTKSMLLLIPPCQ